MRRCVAVGLLLLLVGQSSGAALAGTSDPSVNRVDFLAALVDPAHPAKPQRPIELDAARIMRALHPLHPEIRRGVRREFVMPPRNELDRRQHRLDPLAMRRSTVTPSAPTASAPPAFLEPLRPLTSAQPPNETRAPLARRKQGVKQLTSSTSSTGIEHWWTYEERDIPGIGKAVVNVGTGNFLVSATDVDVPEQGIDLAFRRVYNSQSLHDSNGDDGGDRAIFGNRWTNNYDANIVYNSTGSNPTITVYDLNGSACTYTSDGKGNWLPCTGEYAQLYPTDQSNCTYAWQKKNGTVYWFHTDEQGAGCGIQQAKKGHLQQILARNQNNSITFEYSYNGLGYGAENITEIDAVHSDGQELVMRFGIVPTTSINALATITPPDKKAMLQYSYDTSGNLVEVDKPGNNSASTVPTGHGVPQGDVPETYGYVTGTYTMQEACGPRCTVAMWNHPDSPKDGAAMLFTADGSNRLTSWLINGVLNFTPTDGTNTQLQSSIYATTFTTWYTATFDYGQGACTYSESGATTMCDTDGHIAVWSLDSSNRVTQTQNWTGAAEGKLVTTSQKGWDSNNDLISTTDANGYVTQFAYDTPGPSQGGNVVEVKRPLAYDVYQGNVSPLSYYSYDANSNVIAYCDPDYNQFYGNGWVANPGDNLCPHGGTQYTAVTYKSTASEPYGCLVSISRPMGYQTNISYASGTDQCGVGLPATVVAATQIPQFDGSNRTPTQDLTYDPYGNIKAYDQGKSGSDTLNSWTLGYDSDNRNISRTQSDSKVPNAALISYSCYYPDGSLFYTETPQQHAKDNNQTCPDIGILLSNPNTAPPDAAMSYLYDLDGDQVQTTTHKGCSTNTPCPTPGPSTACYTGQNNPIGTTCKYYDGLDRLIEVAEPYDSGRNMQNQNNGTQPYELYTFRWMNRYIYDLSKSGDSGGLSISDQTGSTASFAAYGNLYKTQEYLPQKQSNMQVGLNNLQGSQYTGNPSWSDVRGASFDGLDRATDKYELAYGTASVAKNTYDQSGQLNLLGQTKNAVGQVTSYTYDTNRHVSQVSFSGTAPQADPRKYQYDADGRVATIANSLGMMVYQYNWNGNRISVTEPSGEHAASLICSYYYPDGLREYVSVGPASVGACSSIQQQNISGDGGISQPHLFSYAYTEDGLLDNQTVAWEGTPQTFSWTYSPGNRELTETDPLKGEQPPTPPPSPPPNGYPAFQTKSYSYDSYGRVSDLTLPQTFEESQLVYDDDDELASYTAFYNKQPGGIQRNLTLNARGELLQDSLPNQPFFTYAQGATYSANGTQIGDGNCDCQLGKVQAPPTTLAFDVRSGMVTFSTNPLWIQYEDNGNPAGKGAYGYSYDAAGRQIGATQYPNWPTLSSPGPGYSTSYDTENHVTQTGNTSDLTLSGPNQTYSSATVTNSGPDGHQAVTSLQYTLGGTDNRTAHWDGDTLLFATSSGWAGTFLYIGKLGMMDNSGDIVVLDRDQTGSAQSMHGNHDGLGNPWFSNWSMGAARSIQIYGKFGSHSIQLGGLMLGSCGGQINGQNQVNCGTPPIFPMNRPDGYAMVGGLVQGARTFDPTSGQWLTPDPYAGDVSDPMSQKPFMWSNNNPVEFSDPTGYITYLGDAYSFGQTSFVDATTHAFIQVTESRMDVSIEYGPTRWDDPFSNLIQQPYGSNKDSPLRELVVLPPVNGISGTALDMLALNVFGEVSNYLASTQTCYCQFNSNTAVAAGLFLMGYSEKQIRSWVRGPGGAGGDATTQGKQLAQLIQLSTDINVAIDPYTGFSAQFEQDSAQATDFEHWGEEWIK
jgi:RHS repeat-associated protein